MLRRLLKDESGVALGLAVIMIVLIGVMGAGLLVFVRNDLQAVVEVNRGQNAIDIADAGVQAAKRQLLSDANRRHYDLDDSNDCGSANPGDSRRIGEDWSPSPDLPNADCTSSTPKSSVGVTRNFAGGRFVVTIQCYRQTGDAAGDCSGIAEDAPENSVTASDQAFFKVTSTGYYPADESGAKRRIEVIFNTYDLGIPKAYFTPNDITLSGTPDVTDVSLFSLGDVRLNGGADITGVDQTYGDWNKPPFNTTARAVPTCIAQDGTSGPCAGIGATGQITGSDFMGTRDYDGPDADADGAEFVENPSTDSQDPDEITFPFDHESQLGDRDKDRIDFLREEAKTNGVYYSSSGGKVYVGDSGDDVEWPADSGPNTVVFVEYTSAGGTNEAVWRPGNDCDDPPLEGTLVVLGGDFTLNQNTTPFEGVVIVRGGLYEEGESVDAGGRTCLEGFVNASGDITIKGSVNPISSGALVNRPGFYGVKQWSWRELYQ